MKNYKHQKKLQKLYSPKIHVFKAWSTAWCSWELLETSQSGIWREDSVTSSALLKEFWGFLSLPLFSFSGHEMSNFAPPSTFGYEQLPWAQSKRINWPWVAPFKTVNQNKTVLSLLSWKFIIVIKSWLAYLF